MYGCGDCILGSQVLPYILNYATMKKKQKQKNKNKNPKRFAMYVGVIWVLEYSYTSVTILEIKNESRKIYILNINL